MTTMMNQISGLFGSSFHGGQAEFVNVPFADQNLLHIPDGVPDERALYISNVVPTSFHVCKRAHIKPGEMH
jgi:threonine dehydrogenase-like Zn-dependent dehydrogenase